LKHENHADRLFRTVLREPPEVRETPRPPREVEFIQQRAPRSAKKGAPKKGPEKRGPKKGAPKKGRRKMPPDGRAKKKPYHPPRVA